jgi:hypothetical protein
MSIRMKRIAATCVQGPSMPTRRSFVVGSVGILVVLAPIRRLHAADKPHVVASSTSVAAIVAAVAGELVDVEVDAALAVGHLSIGANVVDATGKLVLKGKGAARARFLDDARNSPKFGANVRDALAKAHPELAKELATRHKAWSHGLVKKILAWSQRLSASPISGSSLRDAHGRVYLLEWAGAKISPAAASAGPTALAKLPAGPDDASAAAYERYIERLVSAVAAHK